MTVIKPAGASGRQATASCCETAVRASQEIFSREARTREVSTARLTSTNGDQWHADYELDLDLSLQAGGFILLVPGITSHYRARLLGNSRGCRTSTGISSPSWRARLAAL